jgi:hypothetical protein
MSHKVGEWRDGERIYVTYPDPKTNPFGLIVAKLTKADHVNGERIETETTLFVTRAGESHSENMLDAYDGGYARGLADGRKLAQAAMRQALGIDA